MVRAGDAVQALPKQLPSVTPVLAREDIANSQDILEGVRMAQLQDGPDVAGLAGKAAGHQPAVDRLGADAAFARRRPVGSSS